MKTKLKYMLTSTVNLFTPTLKMGDNNVLPHPQNRVMIMYYPHTQNGVIIMHSHCLFVSSYDMNKITDKSRNSVSQGKS